MSQSTSRLLTCLELLQRRPVVTGAELARDLGVDPRTVRRYVAALQELDIPVDGARGRGGGYALRPGFRLPPLMFDDEEAAVVALALTAGRRLGLDADGAADRALGKLRRVLPDGLRVRVEALERVVAFTARPVDTPPPAGAVVLALADAAGRGRRVRCGYTTHAGEHSARELSPFGLVVHAGRWYLAAHDHARGTLRTLRVDRLTDPVLGGPGESPSQGFDPRDHVLRSLAAVPWTWAVRVTLGMSPATARDRIPPALARLEDAGDGRTTVHLRAESLDWCAELLAGLGCAFTIEAPPELRASVHVVAERLRAAAG